MERFEKAVDSTNRKKDACNLKGTADIAKKFAVLKNYFDNEQKGWFIKFERLVKTTKISSDLFIKMGKVFQILLLYPVLIRKLR